MEYKSYEQDSLDLDEKSPFFNDHVSRYLWAGEMAKDLDVLDCASGKGYGSYILSKKAKNVVGIDLNENSLEIARSTFSKISDHLLYKQQSVFDASKLGKFDLIVAFEIIEHIQPEETDSFLADMKKALTPGGKLVLSTPNHDVVWKSKVYIPEFHINNFKAVELKQKLEEFFDSVTMLGPINNIIFNYDFFNLRHVFKNLLKERPPVDRAHAQEKKKTVPIKVNDFDNLIRATRKYQFSKAHWRQAGLSVAICS